MQLHRVVDAILNEQQLAIGIQLSARSPGGSLDLAAGRTLGGELGEGHLHNVYCAAKPLLALAIGHLIDDGWISLDTVVEDRLGVLHPLLPPWPISVGEILRHEAGLAKPVAMVWRLTRRDDRMALIDYRGRERSCEYSEILGGLILEALIEKRSGIDAATFVMDRVVEPLGLRDFIVFDVEDRLAEVLPRIRVSFGGLPCEAIPLLSELIPSQIRDLRPAFGGLATMRALADLYAALGKVYRGKRIDGLPSPTTLRAMLSARRPRAFDPIMNSEVGFASGFIHDLGGSVCAEIGREAFGHAGGFATTLGFHDPSVDMSVAVYLNGISFDAEITRATRQRLVAAIYRELES